MSRYDTITFARERAILGDPADVTACAPEPRGQKRAWVIFIVFLSLPMISGPFGSIDRSIVNIFSLLSAGLVYLLIHRKSSFNIRLYTTYWLILIFLFVQYSKTAVEFGVADGLATLLRYIFYFTVGFVTYHRGIEPKTLNIIIFMSAAICIYSSAVGLIQGRFVFLNGWNRFMGANQTSVGFALETSFCIFLIYAKFYLLQPERRVLPWTKIFYSAASLLFMYLLYLSGSRGPALGVIVLLAMHLFYHHRKSFFILVIAIISLAGYFYNLMLTSSNRLFLLITRLAEVSSFEDIKTMGDGSLFARIRYVEIGVKHIFDNNLAFGAGLNSFQGMYESATGSVGVAAHNDFLMILVEFGYIGLAVFTMMLAKVLFLSLHRQHRLTLFLIVFWGVGYTLNNVFYYHSVATLLVIIFALSLRADYWPSKSTHANKGNS